MSPNSPATCDRAKVISARSLMRACDGAEHGGTVAPDAKIASFSASIVAAGKPFAVVNGTGKPIGEVTPQAVIDLLAGIDVREPAHDGDGKRQRGEARRLQRWLLVWAAGRLPPCWCVFLLQDSVPWAVNYPAEAIVPVADWVSALMGWIKSNLSWLTRSITAVLGVPLDFALDLLAKNFKIGHGADAYVLPRLSWVGVCAAAFLAGHAVGGRQARRCWSAAASSTSRCSANGPAPC